MLVHEKARRKEVNEYPHIKRTGSPSEVEGEILAKPAHFWMKNALLILYAKRKEVSCKKL